MKKIIFKDDGQDVLVWFIDDKGVVQACDMQEWVWKGTEVLMTDREINLENIQPGDRLVCKYKDGEGGTFVHPVEKVENYQIKCRDCRFLSEERVLREGDYPSVRCTQGLWDKPSASDPEKKTEQWYSYGESVLNRGPVKRHGAACTQGLPRRVFN